MASVAINTAASGDNVLLGAQAGCRYRVHSFAIVSAGTTIVKFLSAANVLSGAMSMVANGEILGPYDPNGLMIGGLNEDLIINNTQAIQISGFLDYSIIGSQGGSVGTFNLNFALAKNGGYFLLPLL